MRGGLREGKDRSQLKDRVFWELHGPEFHTHIKSPHLQHLTATAVSKPGCLTEGPVPTAAPAASPAWAMPAVWQHGRLPGTDPTGLRAPGALLSGTVTTRLVFLPQGTVLCSEGRA